MRARLPVVDAETLARAYREVQTRGSDWALGLEYLSDACFASGLLSREDCEIFDSIAQCLTNADQECDQAILLFILITQTGLGQTLAEGFEILAHE